MMTHARNADLRSIAQQTMLCRMVFIATVALIPHDVFAGGGSEKSDVSLEKQSTDMTDGRGEPSSKW